MSYLCIKSSVLVGLSLFALGALAEERTEQETATEINAAFMFDYSLSDGNTRNSLENSSQFNSEIRRARLDLKHRLNNDWSTKLQISYDEEESSSEMGDAYIRYKGWQNLQLTMGKFKEPFGLENMTSSKNTTFLERSMASNGFGPGKNKGFMLSATPGDTTWSFAFVDLEAEEDDSAPYAVTARTTWSAISSSQQTLHLGLSGSLRILDGEEFEIDEHAELHTLEKVIESGEIATDQLQLSAIEMAWVDGPFSLQSEYMIADLQAVDSSENVMMDGYYLQASYFLTGESRAYKNGAFSTIKPKSKEGAWELTLRYSVLDTTQATDGSELQTTTLGVNYYYDKNIRLMGNLIHSQSSTQVNGSDTGNGAAFRIQYLY